MSEIKIDKRCKDTQIVEYILDKIKNNEWPAGTKIPNEFNLAESLNVSRVSIRQAVSQLRGQGILSVRRGDGTFVNEISSVQYFDNVLRLLVLDGQRYTEVQELRKVIEPMIVYIICEKCTEEDLALMQECIDKQSIAISENDRDKFIEQDNRFHRILAEATKNELIIRCIDMVQELLKYAMQDSVNYVGFQDSVEYHEDILNNIRQNKPEEAAKVMYQHIENNITTYKLKTVNKG